MNLEVQPLVHAEISVIPIISSRRQRERYLRFGEQIHSKAFDAIRKIEGINVVLTSMGTHIEQQEILQKY
jgi:uncharacterized protein YqgV (UPF0045/DUF77 family)